MARGLDKDEIGKISEKLMDVGNLTLAALVIGQVLTERKSVVAFIIGALSWVVSYSVAIGLMKRR